MAIFLEDLKNYLTGKGIEQVERDALPAEGETAAGLFLLSHEVGEINLGTGTRTVQIRVRAQSKDAAYALAHRIAQMLDSGMDEELLHLSAERWCIARPRRLPVLLSQEEAGAADVYGLEGAFFCENTP